jgi:type VI secretion system secreted protein Hcp
MAFDAFLKIDGIDGESTDDAHQAWIEVLSYSHGLSQMSSGSRSSSGAATGERCDHQDFSVVKAIDSASPPLYLHCCNGKHIKEVKLTLNRAGEDKNEFMSYTMSDVIVSSISPGGSGGSDFATEAVTFNYGTIKWEYQKTDPKTGAPVGAVQSGWDQEANKAI